MDRKIKSYRIYMEKAHELTKKILDVCKRFPKTDEARIIKGQIIRSSTSIPANIAEGFGADKGRFFKDSLTIARGEVGKTGLLVIVKL